MTSAIVFGQKQGRPRIDSLLSALGSAHDDTNKVKLLNDLSVTYQNINTAEGLKYGQMAMTLADGLHWQQGLAAAYYSLGINHTQRGDYKIAVENLSKGLKIAEQLRDKHLIADNKGGLARIYTEQFNFVKAEEYLADARRYYQELGDKDGLAYMLWLEGAFNTTYNHDYAKARTRLEAALSLFEETGNMKGKSEVMKEIGNTYFYQNDLSNALTSFDKALVIDEKFGFRSDILWVTICLAEIHRNTGKYLESLDLESKAIKMCDELDDKRMKIIATGNIGEAYFDMARDTSHAIRPDSLRSHSVLLRKAIDYFHQALSMSNENALLDDNYVEYSGLLSEAQALTGDYREALASYKLFSKVKDSLFSNETTRKISALEEKQAQEIKQREIEIQKLQLARARIERYALLAGLCLMGVFGFVSYRNYRRKKLDNLIISREKERSEELLLNILPAEVADELKATGAAHAKLFDDVTVLYTDFKSFTTVSQRLTPQELVDELNVCFSAFDTITTKYKIEKIKTVGDAYLAVSGLPFADAEHAVEVVSAALEIREFIRQRRILKGDNTFDIRIGVNSGSVVAGIVGVKKFAYDIWGDTVNTAARMEQNSEPGEINISESTYQLVKEKFHCRYRGEIDAKNKGNLKMYFVGQAI